MSCARRSTRSLASRKSYPSACSGRSTRNKPEGGKMDVRAAVNDGVAEISVTDTGVGISPEDQEAVFEEFRQVGPASKKVEGTGLGLAISRRFIALHGGKIWVTSQVGTGSTFAFTLPLQQSIV